MQIWAESGKSALPICNYSQILYQFLTFTQNLKRSPAGFKTSCEAFVRLCLSFNIDLESGFQFNRAMVLPDNDPLKPSFHQGLTEGL